MVKLNGLVVAVAVAVGGALAAQTASQNEQGDESMTRRIEVYSVEHGKNVTVDVVEVPDDEWRERLTDEQYQVSRQHGTERAFTGALLHNQGEGVYRCVACGNDLFLSTTKYDSGSGWPSFFAPVASANVATAPDRSFGMVRTELRCSRCGAHLGHVFEDGPRPTGQRYCVNSASLAFTPMEIDDQGRATAPGAPGDGAAAAEPGSEGGATDPLRNSCGPD